ncbi:restriction endonuclease [Amycolatopsis anabasis]|uniref:nSTAND3 domain-containing NTPase n=1 Tax=Amycolatopsis anabasis TaxID=1840409 RepID=UPI00131EB777|nr:restriction endonuclease [Amycolatopsis anabasis]
MDSFDLGRLSDYDFEVVCRDLFEEILGLKIEILARGADRGIDLRHMTGDVGDVVIQCKHWTRSGRAKLLAHMRDKERAKITELRPARYILATSVELTADAKDTLLKDLAPYVHNTGDLYGAEQLTEELRKRPALVQRHLRLWLTSTAVLQAVLNQDTLIRSEDLVSELDDAATTFVPTPTFDVARDLLERESVCLLAGIPGIGKSTIAKMLARLHLEKGYQVVDVTQEIGEIDKMWLPKTPQLFFYDDFLGEIALDHHLGKNEDRRLLGVLRRIRKTPGKLLVLTTREYILREAKHRHETLDDGDLEPLTCDVGTDAYSVEIRASILYNHVYYSEISAAEKRKFAVPSQWRDLLWHRNFSPRLVANTLRLAGRDGTEEVAEALLLNFENPERIWARVIEQQLDASAVHLLEVLFTFGRATELDDLHDAWRSYRIALRQSDDRRQFHDAVKVLDGSMIETLRRFDPTGFESEAAPVIATFHNPSIRDYLLSRVQSKLVSFDKLLGTITDASRLHHLVSLASLRPQSVLRDALRTRADDLTDLFLREYAETERPSFEEALEDDWGDEDEDGSWTNDLDHYLKVAIVIDSPVLAGFVADKIENADSVRIGDCEPSHLATLAAHLAATELIPGEQRLRLGHKLLDEAIADRWRAQGQLGYLWSDLTELAELLTDLKVPGAPERLQTIHEDMTDVVHGELRAWLADELAQRAYTARYGNWWDLAEVLSFIEPEDLPEDLRPAYVIATTAAQAGISAGTPTPKAGEAPLTNRPPVHVAEPSLDETLRSLLENLD